MTLQCLGDARSQQGCGFVTSDLCVILSTPVLSALVPQANLLMPVKLQFELQFELQPADIGKGKPASRQAGKDTATYARVEQRLR